MKLYLRVIIALLCLIMHPTALISQVGINTDNTSPDASAMLDVKSTDKGILIPRMTTAQRDNINTPANGLMIYNSTTNSFDYYNGTIWVSVGDTLGNHKASQNIELSGNFLSNDGDNEGLIIDNHGAITVVPTSTSNRPAVFKSFYNGGGYIEINNNAGTRFLIGADGHGFTGGSTSDVVLANWSNGGMNFFTNSTYRGGFSKYGMFTLQDTFQLIDGSQGTGKVLASDASGIATWIHPDSISRTLLEDMDKDTKIYVEKSTDDDIIRFDTKGSEIFQIKQNPNGHPMLSINSINYGFNTLIGQEAGRVLKATTFDEAPSNYNTYIGYQTGYSDTTGNGNTFLGFRAGYFNTDGTSNVYIGTEAGNENKKSNNVFVGSNAGRSNIGGNNIMIGFNSGSASTGSNNIFIGQGAGWVETGSNLLLIDNSYSSIPLIYGNFSTDKVGINRVATTNTLEVGGNASKASAGSWVANSDARLKKNIQPLSSEKMLNNLLALKGVTYEWSDTVTGNNRPIGIQYGFTAQNIQEVFPTLVEEDNQGYLQTAYGTYDAMTVEAIRALNDKNIALEKKVKKLEKQLSKVNELEQLVLQLQAQMNSSTISE